MRSVLIAIAIVVLFVVVYWAGLIAHFPGERLARYVESRINHDPRVAVSLSPVALKWNRLTVERIALDALVEGRLHPVAAFHDTEIPISWELIEGLVIRTTVGEGRLDGYWPWFDGEARIETERLRLESLPAMSLLEPVRVAGELTLTGTMAKVPAAAGELPSGRIRGRGKRLVVNEARVMGLALPSTRLDEVEFQLRLGRTVTVEEVALRGDVQGSISGRITPVLDQPGRSSLQLDVRLAFRPEWIRQWGDLTPLVTAYLNEGRLEGTLQGTLLWPVFRKARKRQ